MGEEEKKERRDESRRGRWEKEADGDDGVKRCGVIAGGGESGPQQCHPDLKQQPRGVKRSK